MLEHIRCLMFKCEFVGADVLVPNELRIYYLQSSVNYSKKAIKNHHGEVPVVVQKEKKN